MIFKSKPKSVMKSYIALHGLVPKQEIKDFHHRIPPNEIWVRQDVYENICQFPWIKKHELYEIDLMKNYGLSYKEAHKRAEIVDGLW